LGIIGDPVQVIHCVQDFWETNFLEKIDDYTFAPVSKKKIVLPSDSDQYIVDLRKCSDNDKNIMNILDNSQDMWKEKYRQD